MRLELATDRMIAEIDGAVGWMTFNNPDRRNAVSLDMWEAIPAILNQFEADPAVRVIVLRGAGDKAFVSGADISQFEQQRADQATIAYYDRIGETATDRLAASPKPTIAMIRGFCVGGGVGIASCCDLRIAAEDTRMAVPAAKLGLGYRWSGVKKLVDLVGPSHAKEIFYTARQFTAIEAYAMGLLTRVVPVDELESFIRTTIDQIVANAPLTMLAAKRTIDELVRAPDQLDRAMCEELVAECFASEDYIEGRRAFMEKRKPVFRGK